MSGWQWALMLPATGLVVRGIYIAITGRKSTSVTWVNGYKYVEHEEPKTGRGLETALAFAGATFLLIAITHTKLGSWARSGLHAKDSLEGAYTVWAWRVFLPPITLFISLFAGLTVTGAFQAFRDRQWDGGLLMTLAAAVAAALAAYLGWFWWTLVS